MSGSEIVDSVLKVAEKASCIDLEQAGKKACESGTKLLLDEEKNTLCVVCFYVLYKQVCYQKIYGRGKLSV